LPKETTVAEGPDSASNLEPYDYLADALVFALLMGLCMTAGHLGKVAIVLLDVMKKPP